MKLNILNSDGTPSVCPHGASVSYPTGTIRRVRISDFICTTYPFYRQTRYDPVRSFVECTFTDRTEP